MSSSERWQGKNNDVFTNAHIYIYIYSGLSKCGFVYRFGNSETEKGYLTLTLFLTLRAFKAFGLVVEASSSLSYLTICCVHVVL